jgi:hypothetical protein
MHTGMNLERVYNNIIFQIHIRELTLTNDLIKIDQCLLPYLLIPNLIYKAGGACPLRSLISMLALPKSLGPPKTYCPNCGPAPPFS